MQQEALESRRIEEEMARRNSILQNTLQNIVRHLVVRILLKRLELGLWISA